MKSGSTMHFASNIIFGPTRAGCPRRAFMRSAPARAPKDCASGRWATSCRSIIRSASPRRSPSSIRCSAAGWSSASCRASTRIISARSVSIMPSANRRRWNSSVILRAAFGEKQPFSFHGEAFHTDSAELAVPPVQRPHPPLWMMSRDPQTLEFCARHAINPGYFLVYPRADAAPRYRVFLENWRRAGWPQRPNIAYSTVVLCRRERCQGARGRAFRASRAYEGFLAPPQPGESFANRVAAFAKMFVGRGEPGASEIMRNVFDPDYLLKHDLVFIGSPETVAAKLRAAAQSGVFNTFMGEFNFADLPEADLMRSIRLFGEKVIPALRGYEPF